MPEPVPNTGKLDEHLLEVVRALHGAVKQGVSHTDDPKIVDKAITIVKRFSMKSWPGT
jgi:hypothetical protein